MRKLDILSDTPSFYNPKKLHNEAKYLKNKAKKDSWKDKGILNDYATVRTAEKSISKFRKAA